MEHLHEHIKKFDKSCIFTLTASVTLSRLLAASLTSRAKSLAWLNLKWKNSGSSSFSAESGSTGAEPGATGAASGAGVVCSSRNDLWMSSMETDSGADSTTGVLGANDICWKWQTTTTWIGRMKLAPPVIQIFENYNRVTQYFLTFYSVYTEPPVFGYFLFLGLPKVQLPTAWLFNSNAYVLRVIRYINSSWASLQFTELP